MEKLKRYLNRRIKHAQKRIDQYIESHGENPNDKFNYYGGFSLGYWEGLLSAYQDMLDEINDMEESQHESSI